MPGWTDNYMALTDALKFIDEAVVNSVQGFYCEYPIPHFYPGLAEAELFAEREMRETIEFGAEEELKRAGFIACKQTETPLDKQSISRYYSESVKARAIKLAQTYNKSIKKSCDTHIMQEKDGYVVCGKCGTEYTKENSAAWT